MTLAKLSAPKLRHPLIRQRLLSDIAEAATPIVWIAGPPGSGKTTLAATYLTEHKAKTLWYQIDADDAEPTDFFHYLSLAAVPLLPRKHDPLPVADPARTENWPPFARRFARHLFSALPSKTILVFDGFQEAKGRVFEDILTTICDEIPEGIKIIVTSHSEPPPVFARQQAAQRMHILNWDMLKLTVEETAALLPKSQIALTAEEVHQKSQGWAAGVVLIAARPQSADSMPAADHSYPELFAYFATQVFERLQQSVQRSLESLSLLPGFTPAVAGIMTNDVHAAEYVQALVKQGLFVERRAGEAGQEWYQFHPLFRAFLRDKLKSQVEPEALRVLAAHAAEITENTGDHPAAIALYLAAGRIDQAIKTLLSSAPYLLSMGQPKRLIELIGALPDEARHENSWILYWKGLAEADSWSREARQTLRQAYSTFAAHRDKTGEFLAAAASLEVMHSTREDFKEMDRWVELVEIRYREDLDWPSENIELRATTGLMLALLFSKPDSPLLNRAAERLFELIEKSLDVNLRVTAATHLLGFCNLRRRAEILHHLITLVDSLKHNAYLTPTRYGQWLAECAMILFFESNRKSNSVDVEKAVEMAETFAREQDIPQLFFKIARIKFDITKDQGQYKHAEHLLTEMEAKLLPEYRSDALTLHYKRCELFLLKGRNFEAQQAAAAAVAVSEAINFPKPLAAIYRGLQGHALIGLGQFEEAIQSFESALHIAPVGHDVHYRVAELLCRAIMANRRGDIEGEREKLSEGLALARTHHLLRWFQYTHEVRIWVMRRALELDVETTFVIESIRALHTMAPVDAPEQWPWPIRIKLLGGFEMEIDGQAIKSEGKAQKKVLEMLKLLGAQGSVREVAIEHVIDELWPELEAADPKASFDTTVHRLRKMLSIEDTVLVADGHIALNPRIVWSDVGVFERLYEQLRSNHEMETAELIPAVDRLLHLYRGPLLMHETAPWCVSKRERLGIKFIEIVTWCGGALEKAAAWEQAIALYERGLQQDNLVESFYRGLMRAHQGLGAKAEALRAYRRCKQILSVVLSLPPSAETEALYQSLITH